MENYYRFISKNRGIYEAVEQDCPRNTYSRRLNKPDGSWLKKAGPDYPGAISFWTEKGLQKYKESGLMAWHVSVVSQPVKVQIINHPSKILYEDAFQIIVNPEDIGQMEMVNFLNFK